MSDDRYCENCGERMGIEGQPFCTRCGKAVGFARNRPPEWTRAEALERMTQALQSLKAARRRGADLKAARVALKGARDYFEAGHYSEAYRIVDELLREFGGPGTE